MKRYSAVLLTIAAFTMMGVLLSATAQRFEDSRLLDSVLDEVFMPCITNFSNFTTAAQQPSAVQVHNTSTVGNKSSTTEDVDIGATYINEFGFCVPYEPGQGLCDNFLSADDFVFIPFERRSLRVVQEAVDGAFNLFTLLPDTECFRAALAMFCYHYFIPCTSSTGQPGLPRPLCLDECITVSVDRCSDEWNTGLTFVASEPQLQMSGLGLPDCCNLTQQIGPTHNCCQPLGEFDRNSLMPSYEVCFPELVDLTLTVASTSPSEGGVSFDVVAIVAGTVSAAAVLILLIVILVISLGLSISLWRRAQRKKKWDAHITMAHATNSLQFNASYISSGSRSDSQSEGPIALRRIKSIYRREFESSNLIIPVTKLRIMEMVGQGEFGSVQKGVLILNDRSERLVAVKTLKDALSQEDMDTFLEESLHMKEFSHLNVLNLYGICVDNADSPMLVMPYMEHGSLLDYLRKKRECLSAITTNEYVNTITECSLLSMCLQIARGMKYLAGLRFIHRDLAARNCMIDGHFNVKVADFGLTKDVYDRNYYRAIKQEKVPARWMPLESLINGLWSEKSDVWSFGVTCWEVFTLGHIPYPGVDVFSIVQFLEKGKRLQKPQSCSEDMFEVMSRCWDAKVDNRPSFGDLVELLGGLLSSRAGYLDLHIDKALTVAEELSATEYSYVDPNRMFRLIQSIRTLHKPPSQDHKSAEPSTNSYMGLLTRELQGTATYSILEQKATTTVSSTTPDKSHTQEDPSMLNVDDQHTATPKTDIPHYVNTKPKKMGSKAELIAAATDSGELTESGYVNSKMEH